jgi:hypothetical protein
MITKFTQSISLGASQFVTRWIVALALPLLVAQTAQAQLPYQATVCNDPYVQAFGQAGTTLLGSGDDVIFANVALPFPVLFYGTNYTTANIGTNGFMLLNPGTNRGLGNANLPTAIAGACLYPFWDDLDINPATTANAGVYTRTDGVAPNRIFTIEWYNAGHFADVANQVITFQIRLFENGNRIQYKYFDTIFGGSQAAFNNGASATVGLEGPLPAPRPFTLVGFNTMSVMSGQCIEFVQPAACNPIAGPTLNLNTTTGLCASNATITLPTFNPAGCANGTTTGLRYSVNGGAFTNLTFPLPASITINGLPKGANVILWQTYTIPAGLIAGQATQIVNVADNEPPGLVCPANIIVNLNPGECCQNVTWQVPVATDNCPFLIGPFTLNTINSGGNANSSGGMVFFNLNNTSGQPISITAFGLNISNGTNVNVYTKAGTHVGFETNAGAWTLSGTLNANTGPFSGAFPGNGTITPAPVSSAGGVITIPPGLWGICLHPTGAQSIYTNGNGANQTYTDGNITLNLGSTSNTPWGAPFTPRVFNGFVRYQIGGAAQVVQTAGPANGAEFCKENSPYTIAYQVADAAGNTATCSFTVTVNAYPNAVTTLICNDQVQVSLDPNCSAFVNADQVLEGGPYKCYDDYVVEVDKTLPFGNGPWQRVSQGPAFPGFGVPTPLGPGDVGKTYQVRVTDPATGNKCWGNITIEDKLAPVLDCPSASIPCNVDPTPLPEDICPEIIAGDKKLTQNVAFTNYWTGYMNNVENLSGAPLSIKAVRVQASLAGAAAGTYNLKAYMRNGTFVGNAGSNAGWTLCGDVNVNVTAAFPTVLLYDIPFTTQFTVPGSSTAGFYIVANNGNGTTVRVVAELATTQTSDGTLRIVNNPGRWVNGLFGGEAFPAENPRPQIEFTYASSVKAPGLPVCIRRT